MSSLTYPTYARATPGISEEELRAQAQQIFREESAAQRRRGVDVAWYAPPDVNINRRRGVKSAKQGHMVYLGEHGQAAPSWNFPAFDLSEKERVERKIAKIQSEGGEITEAEMREFDLAPYVGEVKNWAHEYWDAADEMSPQKVAAGGIIQSDENAAVNVINVLQEMIGQDRREYALVANAVRTIATPNLTLSVDSFQGINAYSNVGEGVEVDQQKGAIARQNFILQKDVGSIGITDEARMTSERPLWEIHMDAVTRAMTNIKNVRVQAALESSAVTGSASSALWTAYHATSVNNSAINPAAQILTVADTIYTNQGRANTIVSNVGALSAYLGNTFIQGNQGGTVSRETGPHVVGNVPGLPGFTWIIDPLMTAGRVTIYDKNSLLLLQGPVRTAQVRKDGAGIDVYFTKDWNNVAILDATHFRNITSVA